MNKLLKNKKTGREYIVTDVEYASMLKDERLMKKYDVTDLLGRAVITPMKEVPIEVKKITKKSKE